MPQTPTTRWCPTPEQLMILEEMYRSGVRTPNAAEIQQITAHLAYYAPIEGKNVFYWFQNHKARERQRLRRRLCARHQMQLAAAGAPPSSAASGSGGAAGVHHPPAMHPSYATANFIMPQPHHLAAALPVVHHHPAAGGEGGAALYGNNSSPQEEWTMEELNSSTSPGSSDDGTMLPRPLKTLDLFPTKSSAGGLKDECSSSKSSCTTSTN